MNRHCWYWMTKWSGYWPGIAGIEWHNGHVIVQVLLILNDKMIRLLNRHCWYLMTKWSGYWPGIAGIEWHKGQVIEQVLLILNDKMVRLLTRYCWCWMRKCSGYWPSTVRQWMRKLPSTWSAVSVVAGIVAWQNFPGCLSAVATQDVQITGQLRFSIGSEYWDVWIIDQLLPLVGVRSFRYCDSCTEH
jgi:hypothetical protein